MVQSNSMDTLAITSNELDDSKLIDINQFDFVISDPKQKHVREAQTYKDKSTVVAVMRRYTIEQRFQYKVHRSNSKRQVSSAFVGGIIASKYENHKRKYMPRDIIDDMKLNLGVDISYMKAWCAKEKALNMLRGGIVVDGSHLKSKHKGTFVSASTLDGSGTENLYTVNDDGRRFIVCLESKTCNYRRFQIDEILCSHAWAVIESKNLGEDAFCSDYYKPTTVLKTYEVPIYPLLD
ncbi:hypothetical protein HAX54_043274 [Datura stramonium]|uniref:Zinc finger PMZ-type domain-containing protein n=1 Tax=Datura stramonium TaxID=4076 RepID=A0ABS8W3I1_DATST|nr:hypothetical protein [Datura stramonium]